MARPEKEAIVKEVADKLSTATGLLVVDFSGLKVEETNELRKACREASVEYKVVKNTLARLAVKTAGCQQLWDYLRGPTAFLFGDDDPAAPARVVWKFIKENEKPKVKIGLFEGRLVDPSQLESIATLPPKEVLISQVMSRLNSPLVGFLGVLQGVLAGLVRVLNAIKDKRR